MFAEPQFNPGVIQAVITGGEVKTAELDPIGLSIQPGTGFYVALITGMAETMAECL